MFRDLPAEEITACIERIAEEAVWEAGLHEPPVDAFKLALVRGAVVAEDGGGGPRARRVVHDGCHPDGGVGQGVEVILVAPESRPERRHWAVAHEIGESLAWRVFDDLRVDPRDASVQSREWVANRLACALLLPRQWFVDGLVEGDADLFVLKQKFSTVSHELIARRWLETIGGPILVTVCDQGEVTWRRTNFGSVRPAMTREERDAWQASHERAEATEFLPACYVDSGALSRARCWPVHEPGWRREIILAEIAESW